MKNLNNISQNWRKLTAALLLLNFFIAPMLYAFPQEECNSVCEMSIVTHECGAEEIVSHEKSCCDMMKMGSTKKNSSTMKCGMELSDINCALVFHTQVIPTYIIPKTIDDKVDFIILPMFNVEEDISSIVIANYSQEISLDSSPPIYLMISSFLN